MSETREDGMPTSAEERALRRMLGLYVGARIVHYGGFYTDDGEMQFSPKIGSPIKGFDFMRSSIEEIHQFQHEINKQIFWDFSKNT